MMNTTTGGITYEQWRPHRDAMARRNRAALEKARAKGASTWVREEFRRGDDGVIRLAKQQVGTTAAPRERDHPPRTGRAPRQAANTRRQGSRRTTSPTRAGPDDPDEPEPPLAGRLCGCGCRESIAHKAPQARYLNDTHAATDRQRRKRARDQAPALTDVGLAPVRCACWPQHNVVEHGHCVKCGHARRFELAEWIYGPAPGSRQLVVHGSTARKPRYGDRKRRPRTERFDTSIINTGVAA